MKLTTSEKQEQIKMRTRLMMAAQGIAKDRIMPTASKATIQTVQTPVVAHEAVLYGGTPAPEYQTRPDAWEIECEEENA